MSEERALPRRIDGLKMRKVAYSTGNIFRLMLLRRVRCLGLVAFIRGT
jgi:hypothetical protein